MGYLNVPNNLKIYCIGHKAPVFAPPMEYEMLCPYPLGMTNEIVIEDERFGQSIDGGALAEYSQLFGLYDLISSGDVLADNLFLFQYRKFISPNKGGAVSVWPWIRVVEFQEASLLFPSMELLKSISSRIVVGTLGQMAHSMASSYAGLHSVDDFVLFTAACAKSAYLSESDIKAFTTQRVLIPSPALCLINVELFMLVMKILKDVWNIYGRYYLIKREGYQRRSAGYLLERLHGHLLLKFFSDGTEKALNVCDRYIVVNDAKDPDQMSQLLGTE
jgi:hypothetical protein